MTKTKYIVYRQVSVSAMYVTTQRNCEDMIRQIRKLHEFPNNSIYPDKIKIVRIINGERKIVYTTADKKKFEKCLVD